MIQGAIRSIISLSNMSWRIFQSSLFCFEKSMSGLR